jgi:pimeloyl-ACP methyl ester carboxylesterase
MRPLGSAVFTEMMLTDLIPMVERAFRVAPGRENRAMAGLSMGGMQVLEWLVSRPHRVRSVIAIATAARHSPQQIAFHEVMGEPLFRTDLSISVGALGSLLDHSGPIGGSEKYAARVFGSHRSYTVTNGTSTSNRVIFMACATDGEIVLCDRNCHKSIEHSLTLTGARPVYLLPSRNYLGDVYSLVLYPPMSSHRALSVEERARVGINENLVRLSVGIEEASEIIADLQNALEKSSG